MMADTQQQKPAQYTLATDKILQTVKSRAPHACMFNM